MHDVPEACLWIVTTVAFLIWEFVKIAYLPFSVLTMITHGVETQPDSRSNNAVLVVSAFGGPLILALNLNEGGRFTFSFLLYFVGLVGSVLGFGFGIFLARRRKAGKPFLPFLKWPIRS